MLCAGMPGAASCTQDVDVLGPVQPRHVLLTSALVFWNILLLQ